MLEYQFHICGNKVGNQKTLLYCPHTPYPYSKSTSTDYLKHAFHHQLDKSTQIKFGVDSSSSIRGMEVLHVPVTWEKSNHAMACLCVRLTTGRCQTGVTVFYLLLFHYVARVSGLEVSLNKYKYQRLRSSEIKAQNQARHIYLTS